MADRPNVVILMSDQHNPHVMGCSGDDIVRTPNLDALAARGQIFDNCYCPSPLCGPSRASLMTGRYPTNTRKWTNGCMLDQNIPTFAHGLGAAGYETALAGRMHFVGPDQRHGFEKHPIGTTRCWMGQHHELLPQKLLAATGQSRIAVTTSGPGRTGYQVYDEEIADTAVEYLHEQANGSGDNDRPFCLVCGFVLPHCPFVCPQDDWDYYIDRVNRPQIPDGYFDNLHPAMQLWRENRDIEGLTDNEIIQARAGYFGLVTHFDRQIGKVIDAIEESGLTDDTLIIYTSDHGEMAGEHGLWWKSNYYEGSVSIPLIVSWADEFEAGIRHDHIVNTVDLAPTLLDLAGGDDLPDIDGRSLLPILTGPDASWREETFSEHYPSMGLPPSRMIRSGQWKLVHFDGYRPQLFNLEDDPEEWNDLGQVEEFADIRDDLLSRVLDGWSAADMNQTLKRRARANEVLRAWYDELEPECQDQWSPPPELRNMPQEYV